MNEAERGVQLWKDCFGISKQTARGTGWTIRGEYESRWRRRNEEGAPARRRRGRRTRAVGASEGAARVTAGRRRVRARGLSRVRARDDESGAMICNFNDAIDAMMRRTRETPTSPDARAVERRAERGPRAGTRQNARAARRLESREMTRRAIARRARVLVARVRVARARARKLWGHVTSFRRWADSRVS